MREVARRDGIRQLRQRLQRLADGDADIRDDPVRRPRQLARIHVIQTLQTFRQNVFARTRRILAFFRQLLEMFRELSRSGSTIVLVTHDNNIAAQAARRIEIRDGKIVNDVQNPKPE